ncbi:hypothetical protein [Streptomyces erythrochromogenes]|uniref:hypothetical protein n=1 Tax=Streptomyces erythrochromogenes TaxID=285574 RepID=UPI003809C60E
MTAVLWKAEAKRPGHRGGELQQAWTLPIGILVRRSARHLWDDVLPSGLPSRNHTCAHPLQFEDGRNGKNHFKVSDVQAVKQQRIACW